MSVRTVRDVCLIYVSSVLGVVLSCVRCFLRLCHPSHVIPVGLFFSSAAFLEYSRKISQMEKLLRERDGVATAAPPTLAVAPESIITSSSSAAEVNMDRKPEMAGHVELSPRAYTPRSLFTTQPYAKTEREAPPPLSAMASMPRSLTGGQLLDDNADELALRVRCLTDETSPHLSQQLVGPGMQPRVRSSLSTRPSSTDGKEHVHLSTIESENAALRAELDKLNLDRKLMSQVSSPPLKIIIVMSYVSMMS